MTDREKACHVFMAIEERQRNGTSFSSYCDMNGIWYRNISRWMKMYPGGAPYFSREEEPDLQQELAHVEKEQKAMAMATREYYGARIEVDRSSIVDVLSAIRCVSLTGR